MLKKKAAPTTQHPVTSQKITHPVIGAVVGQGSTTFCFFCLVMKVFEKCIQRELYAACADLLDAKQHGFLNEKSCTTQMVPFIDY